MGVLVTGGAGYIGSHMAWRLVDAGESVVVLDNLSKGDRAVVPPAARFVEGDVGDEALLDTLLGGGEIDAVIHFAGSIVVPESVEDPLGYYLNNTVKSRTLMAACVRSGVRRFIFSSTAAVYGMPELNPITEDAPVRPISPYGTSKWMTEEMLRDTAAAHDLRYVALRYFNVAGADPNGRAGQVSKTATHLIKIACQTALGQREKMTIFGEDYPTDDGTGVRDYIHVSDLIEAHFLALGHLRSGGQGGVFNCGYGHGYSVRQVIATMEEVIGRPLTVEVGPRRAGDPAALVADSRAIRERFGWAPAHDDLAFILKTALDWEIRYTGASL